MKIRTLVWQEIVHRRGNFLLGLFSVAAAAALSVGVVTLLESCRLRTDEQSAAQRKAMQAQVDKFQADQEIRIRNFQAQNAERVWALDDEIRKITKNLGFNLLIVPADQNLTDFYAKDFAEKTMPQQYVNELSKSQDLVTIAHLRSALVRRIDWPERKRPVLLMGVSGIVPLASQGEKKPLSDPVPPGTVEIGSALARELSLKPKSEVTIRGEKFRVGKVHAPQGNKDDITVWIDLATAQKMLGLPGRINQMQALECNCATVDRLGDVQQEITRLLGGNKVQVIELATTALARAKARNEVQDEGLLQLESLRVEGKASLERLRAEQAATLVNVRNTAARTQQRLRWLSALVLPLAIIGACLMVGLISLINVRERRGEIGILRALGARSSQIRALVMARSAMLGLLGAAVGYAGGYVGAVVWDANAYGAAEMISKQQLFVPGLLLGVVALGPLLSMLAGSVPARMAVAEDPATALREE